MTLDDRIRAAFDEGTSPSTIAALIPEVDAAAAAAGEASERARTRALDPIISAQNVAAAKADADSAAFTRDRLLHAIPRLREHLVEVQHKEREAARRVAYDAALAETTKLAAEFGETYPALAEQLADLVGRVALNEQMIKTINRNLPSGASDIKNAELLARGIDGFTSRSGTAQSILLLLKMPAFEVVGLEFLWPPKAPAPLPFSSAPAVPFTQSVIVVSPFRYRLRGAAELETITPGQRQLAPSLATRVIDAGLAFEPNTDQATAALEKLRWRLHSDAEEATRLSGAKLPEFELEHATFREVEAERQRRSAA